LIKIVSKKIIRKVVVNIASTEYEIVKKCAKNIFNAKLKYFYEDHEGAIINGEGN
jgi:hypothetical protein